MKDERDRRAQLPTLPERDVPTDPAPPPSQRDPSTMSDRELMICLLAMINAVDKRLDKIERRLGDGDGMFTHLNANVGLLVNSVRELCLERGRKDLAEQIDREIIAGRQNGSGDADAKTDPGGGE